MKFRALLLATMLCTLCIGQASALEYTMDAPDDYLFGRPTSEDTIYEWEDPNVDRSKNTALIPPTFGSPTSYLPGSGLPLTPNLVPGALTGGPRSAACNAFTVRLLSVYSFSGITLPADWVSVIIFPITSENSDALFVVI